MLIVADVLTSGQSIKNLIQFVTGRRADVAGVVAIIDATGVAERLGFTALIHLEEKTHIEGDTCPGCVIGEPFVEVDPFTSMPLPAHVPSGGRQALLDSREFWDMTLSHSAVREGHLSLNGHHYSLFVDTRKIFQDPTASRTVLLRMIRHFNKPFDAIVCPSHESAISLARCAPDIFETAFPERPRPTLVPAIRMPQGEYVVSEAYRSSIRGKAVLVLDDGANFGDTLIGLLFGTTDYHPESVDCCVFLDRLTPFYRRKLDLILSSYKSSLTSVFYLPFPVYRPAQCPLCRRICEAKETERSALSAEMRKSARRERLGLTVTALDGIEAIA